MGLLHESIEPPVVIPTVPHVPWQQQNLRLPKSTQDAATEHVKQKLALGVLEYSQGPYRSRYFLVAKKTPGEWRFINDVQPLNRVTIRDSGMPPSVDEFSEEFAGLPITSSIDYFSSFHEIPLARVSRDLTAFLTALGLVRLTRMPQGWTNSVAVFQRIICKVHFRQIPHEALPFLDDVALKGPKCRYNDELISPGVRRFVFEHAQVFRRFMEDAWRSGLTISGHKCCIGMSGIVIVGMVCDSNGRRPEEKKVQKIAEWPTPMSIRDARGFIGLALYYRIFILAFSIIAAPIFALFRKGARFSWDVEKQAAMDELKRRLMTAPVLIALDFTCSALGIVLQVDASTSIGWGGVMSQFQSDGTLRPARFEGGVWSEAERKYDAVKLECRGLLKALKKLRFWLYGRFFTVETDARTLVWLLNQSPNDLPNAMMTRWLSYIRLFDFDVRHIPGNKNGAADALSRRLPAANESDSDPESADDYFESKLYSVTAAPAKDYNAQIWFQETDYEGDDLVLGRYLETLERPEGLSDNQFRQLRKKSHFFLVRNGRLYKRSKKSGIPPRRVLGLEGHRRDAVKSLHDENGHPGVLSTYGQISRRYQWKGMYGDIADFCKSCDYCQRRARTKYEEPLHPTWSLVVWTKVGVDVVYMPDSVEGFRFIVFARDDLSGWVEGRAIDKANAKNVAKFLYEEVICRHGCPAVVVLDRGSENLNIAKELLEAYKIDRIATSAYHPQANGLIERGHDPIVNALSKYCSRAPQTWPRYLPLAMWADRISVRRSTGYSAFELVYGRDALLPVDLTLESWSIVDWEGEVDDHESLLRARMRQLDERNLRETRAATNLENSRRVNKAYFDQHKRLRGENQELHVGDLVLLQTVSNQPHNRSRARKLDDKWRGPFRIRAAPEHSTYYRLAELDGVELAGAFAGNRLKKFFSRAELDRDREGCRAVIRVVNDLEDEDGGPGRVEEEIEEEEDLYGNLGGGLEVDEEGGLIL